MSLCLMCSFVTGNNDGKIKGNKVIQGDTASEAPELKRSGPMYSKLSYAALICDLVKACPNSEYGHFESYAYVK